MRTFTPAAHEGANRADTRDAIIVQDLRRPGCAFRQLSRFWPLHKMRLAVQETFFWPSQTRWSTPASDRGCVKTSELENSVGLHSVPNIRARSYVGCERHLDCKIAARVGKIVLRLSKF